MSCGNRSENDLTLIGLLTFGCVRVVCYTVVAVWVLKIMGVTI